MAAVSSAGTHTYVLSTEVEDALHHGRPVVALESNVIAHGYRWPENLEVARAVERVVREGGAVPATVMVESGQVMVGADDAALERFARSEHAAKVTRRDLGIVLAGGGLGATSISATMAIADQIGIRTIASAGLGGVHRGAEHSMDISSDLTELARTELIVVCAGVKMILDAGRTLEFLETQGTPVIGFRHEQFPAFYCRDSGFPTQIRLDHPHQIAETARRHWGFPHSGSILVTHPIPREDALDSARIELAIDEALASAKDTGVVGAGITPFVLRAVDAATGGEARAANRAVLLSTAAAATEIEVARATSERGVLDGVH
ncbi:pseudouridine-5'-phosphate glycosidase [Williamsia sterculiae]|uniref:Pseudouridine-5'-phosphate glycosidase n=1 Tax=Williamsia sterculiae TaxID=1344003 RepID=A0A1N7EK90_9NOCA|nr:pseudouridine-5'-phosphate glycosidase [Williamsia sterculiae]SIR88429.1 pseudouridine-5'-phosphate glycosidase [Williamsia sterculiae]